MSRHVALTDCPLRVVVELPQSACGFTYPRIFIEAVLGERYINADVTLGAAFKMQQTDFEEWWEDAEPADVAQVCREAGFNEDGFRNFIRGFLSAEVNW